MSAINIALIIYVLSFFILYSGAKWAFRKHDDIVGIDKNTACLIVSVIPVFWSDVQFR